jgi:hypothetical protein
MKTTRRLLALAVLFLLIGTTSAAADECRVEGAKATVTEGGATSTFDVEAGATTCLLHQGRVFVAAGARGVLVYSLDGEGRRLTGSWGPGDGEVIGLQSGPGGLMAISARLALVPLQIAADGSLRPAGVADLLGGRAAPASTPTLGTPPDAVGEPDDEDVVAADQLPGTVVKVRGDIAVLDVGSDAGVGKGDRFEIRSQALTRQYDLETGVYEPRPSDQITAVVEVTSVSPDKALVSLGRGDRARVGDHALPTDKKVSGNNWFPGYERSLNRIQAKAGPYLGINTLSAGMLASVMYDRTFAFPMRLSAGFSNVGLIFGEDFGAPFHLDVIPSYDTDYFEVGLGLGYVFSSHERRRGLSFLQKVRLGTVDGLNLTVQNAFIYERRRTSSWFGGGGAADSLKMGEDCTPTDDDEDLSGYEFNWEGIDATLAMPLNRRVTMVMDWSFSNAGWLYGDIGIRTLVMGNGGHGTLIIPVTIGGVGLNDYVASGKEIYCDADSKEVSSLQEYDSRVYAGPVVTIGIDYRWR